MGIKHSILLLFLSFAFYNSQGQTCSGAPNFNVNLIGQPAGSWTSPDHSRGGTCCSANNCTSFDVKLDTGAAMINLEILSGAIPSGSLSYRINCGSPIAVGSPICVTGQYSFTITFCKSGNNPNVYKITSIAKPTLPANPTYSRLGCINTLTTLGFVPGSVTWTSTPQGGHPAGYYNYLLSSTTSTAPLYTPTVGLPASIIYSVCGTPQNSICPGSSGTYCGTFTVINVGPITASVTPTSAGFCAGGSISITATASGGATPYTYIWKNQSNVQVGTGAVYTASVAGTYQLEVRDKVYDATSCPALLLSVPVQVTQPPTANAGDDKTVCTSSPAVSVTGSATNQSSVVWSGGAGTYSPSNTSATISYTPTAGEISAGFVNLTFTAIALGGGCSNASDVVKIIYPPLLVNSIPSYSLACNASTTTITPVLFGGIAPYTYSWDNGATTSGIVAGEGNYCMTLTDSKGCSAASCSNITVPTVLTLSTSATDVTTVAPANEGTTSAFPAGGTSPYSYAWTGGQTTQTATGLVAGGYTVTVTDANGCTVKSNVVVNSVSCSNLAVVITPVDVLCNGGNTGGAVAVPSGGGGAPYTYSWNTIPVKTSSIVVGLSAGPYQVLVTSSNGCTRIDNVTINQPTILSSSMSHTDATKVGSNNGTATVTASGGTSPYTYSWSPSGGTTSVATGLIAGGYTVTVSDANGCSLLDSVRIQEPSCVALVLNMSAGNVSCFNGTNGTASANLLFGTTPYSYVWSVGGQTTSAISSLPAGNVSVVVTDAVNCVLQNTITITEPAVLTSTLVATDVLCNGGNTGTLNLSVAGGTFPYSYLWSNGITVEDQGNLSIGFYGVTVTDAQGCTVIKSATINEPTAISAISTHQNVTCKNGSDGTVNATVSGGLGAYTYLWTNAATTKDLSGLVTGQYILSVTDGNGCVNPSALNIFINEPDSVDLSSYAVTCPVPGSGISKVDVVPVGGDGGPYTVSFDNGATYLSSGVYSQFLPVGATYSVFVKDGNGCISSLQKIVVNPAPSIASITFPFCNPVGVGTATVTVTPAGGAGIPYLVSTNNGVSYDAKGDYKDTLAIGNTYVVIIKDTLGCLSLPSSIVIPDSISLDTAMSVYAGGYNISCKGLSNGSINLTASGGTTPYTFLWNNGTSTYSTQNLSNIPAGNYSLTITDSKGCSKSMIVPMSEPLLLASTSSVSTNYNGSSVSCFGSTNGAIDLSVSGGTAAYTYGWSNSLNTQDISGLAAGTYSVLVTDKNGCTTTNSITLTQPVVLTTTIAVSSNYNGQNISCNGLSNGSIDLSVAGGTVNYTYSWTNTSQITQDITGLSANTYSVLVTDQNGCKAVTGITLTQPAVLTTTVAVSSNYNGQNISCNGLSNGAIDLSVAGGTTAYTYSWSNAQTTQDISGLNANTYSVLVTDKNGCAATNTIVINQPAPLSNTIVVSSNYNGQNISCNGLSDGSIDLSVSGGATAYTYSWSNAQTIQDISGLNANTYSVLVTDVNGCTTTNTITITQPAVLTTSIAVSSNYNGQNVSCFGSSNGSIDLSVAGGTTAYTYNWSNSQATQDVSGLAAGTYSVLVTDKNGCIATNTITLTQPVAMSNTIVISSNYNGQNISCNGLSDGSVDLSVSGGTAAYTYSWSNSATTQDISGLAAGAYTVTVTDVNGCTGTGTVSLSQPLPVAATSTITNVTCNGFSNGSIDISASGGTPAYLYSWSNAATTQDITAITAGNYTVTVTDVNGCTGSLANVVIQDQSLVIAPVSYNLKCNKSNDGSIIANISGGVSPYQFSWSNGASTQNLSGISAGTYIVQVTDSNSCVSSDTVVIIEPDTIAATYIATFYPNGFNVTLNGASDGFVDLTVVGGTTPYNFLWSTADTSEDLANAPAGDYFVQVTDSNGCVILLTLKLTEPFVLQMPTGLSPNGDGLNDYFVIHGLESYPDNNLEVYNRWGNLVFSQDNYKNDWTGHSSSGGELPAATYFVVLKINGDKATTLTGYVDLRR